MMLAWLAYVLAASAMLLVAPAAETPAAEPLTPKFPEPAGRPIEKVADIPGLALNGVAVSPGGRIFISLPRWGSGDTPGVAELLPDGTYRPFPGGEWNTWTAGAPTSEALVSVHSIYADHDNFLWIVDEGPPLMGTAEKPVGARPKVIQVDLGTNKVVRVYTLDEAAAPAGSDLGHLRTDGSNLYVSELGLGSLIVIDRKSGQAHRRLTGATIGQAHRSIIPVIAGVPLTFIGGRPIYVNLDLLELDGSGRKLYFMPLFGPALYSVTIEDLTNWSLSDEELARRAKFEVMTPPSTGLTKSADGTLYICSITDMAIMRLDPRGEWEIVARDPRLYLPNEPSFAPNGDFYFPVSRLGPIPDLGIKAPPAVYRVRAAASPR